MTVPHARRIARMRAAPRSSAAGRAFGLPMKPPLGSLGLRFRGATAGAAGSVPASPAACAASAAEASMSSGCGAPAPSGVSAGAGAGSSSSSSACARRSCSPSLSSSPGAGAGAACRASSLPRPRRNLTVLAGLEVALSKQNSRDGELFSGVRHHLMILNLSSYGPFWLPCTWDPSARPSPPSRDMVAGRAGGGCADGRPARRGAPGLWGHDHPAARRRGRRRRPRPPGLPRLRRRPAGARARRALLRALQPLRARAPPAVRCPPVRS